jgi:hypothetical protein
MRTLDVIAAILLIIGGLNWGLVGVFNFDLVANVFGRMTAISRIVYTVVGLCALYWVMEWGAMKRRYGEAAPGRPAPTPTA